MSELRSKDNLFDIEKEGVCYKKLVGNCLMVLRKVTYRTWWKTIKHVDYDIDYIYRSYSNIEIPKEVDGMKVVSVESCSNAEITNVSFPETINSFGKDLYCVSNVAFPSKVTDSHYETINRCNNITLPNSVKTIGAIWNCNMLTIPTSVVCINKIEHQPSIVKMESPMPPILTKNDYPHERTVILVPKGSLDAYKNDPMWGKFKTIREDPTMGKGTAAASQQTPATNNGVTEKEIAELKCQIVQRQEEMANLKKQLAKKDNEIAELKRQLEAQKASELSKPQPAPVRPLATTQSSTSAVPTAKGVFKLEEYKSKGKLCHAIVKTYVEQHPDVTLAQLKQVFSVPKSDHIVESLDVAMTIKDSAGKAGGDFYIKEADQIKIKECMVVVWSYWPERYYPDFIANARKAGFIIE